jgi:hypothetical protein
MPEEEQQEKNQSDKPDIKPAEGTIHNATVRIQAGVRMEVRPRLIQQSPTANLDLVEAARKLAQKLQEQEAFDAQHIPEAPLILPDE